MVSFKRQLQIIKNLPYHEMDILQFVDEMNRMFLIN